METLTFDQAIKKFGEPQLFTGISSKKRGMYFFKDMKVITRRPKQAWYPNYAVRNLKYEDGVLKMESPRQPGYFSKVSPSVFRAYKDYIIDSILLGDIDA